MSNINLTDIIKGVKQPTFDDEMITQLIEGMNVWSNYYHFIQDQNAISNDSGEIDREAEQELWRKKAPGENQKDVFRHMGSSQNINYCFSRLYVNCSKEDLMQLAHLITDKCSEQELPLYFKYSSDNSKRSDQLVVYSNLENLSDYIQILQEIGQEYPEIIERCGKPPLLTGTIDDWIGIGDEPTVKDASFTEIRANVIQDVLSRVTPTIIDEKGCNVYSTDGLDFEVVRDELRKAFEEIGVNIDTFSFNNENLQLYFADEQTRKEYDAKRKQQQKDDKTTKQKYLLEQIPYQELKILKQMGIMPEEIGNMIAASSSRYGLATDITKERVNMSDIIQKKYGLPTNTMVTDKAEIFFRTPDGKIDLTEEQKQQLSPKLLKSVTAYYTKFFQNEKETIDETLSRYAELYDLPLEQDEVVALERTDLSTRLKMLVDGKHFFEAIGIQSNETDLVYERIQSVLDELQQKKDEKEAPAMKARKSMIDREYLQTIFEETGITDIDELRKLYEENREKLDVLQEDFEAVLATFSDNGTIEPSQIGTDTTRAGIGVADINQSAQGIRESISQDKLTVKGDGELRQ